MAKSLRCKIDKLRHDRRISATEYEELIAKLNGHDEQLRKATAEAVIDKYKNDLIGICDASEISCSFCQFFNQDECCLVLVLANEIKEGRKNNEID